MAYKAYTGLLVDRRYESLLRKTNIPHYFETFNGYQSVHMRFVSITSFLGAFFHANLHACAKAFNTDE